MKLIFFEIALHLGFLLCHIGCKLTGHHRIEMCDKLGNVRAYYETTVSVHGKKGDRL